jgi:hypothetical protein
MIRKIDDFWFNEICRQAEGMYSIYKYDLNYIECVEKIMIKLGFK